LFYLKPSQFSFCNIVQKRKKTGVGRKVSYSIENEELLVWYAMIKRDQGILELKKLKEVALETIGNNNFMASDGWVRKFLIRNKFNITDRYNVPARFPK